MTRATHTHTQMHRLHAAEVVRVGLAWGKTHRESLGRFDHATVECTRAPCTPRLRPALPNHRCNPSTSRLHMNVQLNARAGHVLWNASRRRQHRRSIGASPVNPVNPSIRWALEHLLFTLPLQAAPGLWPGVERHTSKSMSRLADVSHPEVVG